MRHWIAYATLGVALLVALITPSVQGRAPAPPAQGGGFPSPRSHVVIRVEDTPYTVPTGAILAVTGAGASQGFGGAPFLRINGERALQFIAHLGYTGTSVQALPIGLTARAGDVVDFEAVPPNVPAVAYGYLVRE
jgi:hypothetical protein